MYTITVGKAYRRAINRHYGKPGLATRNEVQAWQWRYGSSEDENLMFELQCAIERGEEVDPDG
jgi:hypothetical protein